jgi:hypothetical protein
MLVVGSSAGAFALFKLRSKLPLKRESSETVTQQEPVAPAPVRAAEAQP